MLRYYNHRPINNVNSLTTVFPDVNVQVGVGSEALPAAGHGARLAQARPAVLLSGPASQLSQATGAA